MNMLLLPTGKGAHLGIVDHAEHEGAPVVALPRLKRKKIACNAELQSGGNVLDGLQDVTFDADGQQTFPNL